MRGLLLIAGLLALPGTALAQQTDYSAGKSPAQLFSGDCAACHSSPKGLAKNQDQRSLTSFLREHYTTRSETAGALAAYLMGNPGTAAPVRNPAEPQGRAARGAAPGATPAAATPAARQAPPADEDPFRRIFRSGSEPDAEPSIAAPEPGEAPAPGAKPKPGAKPRTAAKPPEGKPEAHRGKENAKGKKPEPSEATREAKPEDSAKESSKEAVKDSGKEPARDSAVEAAKAEAAKADAAKAEAARAKVRAYATTGEEARPKGDEPATPPAAAAPAPAEKPASPPPG